MLFLLHIFVSLFQIVVGCCPQGTIQGINPDDCYKVFSVPSNWVAAEQKCVQNGGHLASISSAYQNSFVQQQTGLLLYNTETVWIGANTLYTPGTWSWTDGTSFVYQSWGPGQPAGNQGLCGTFNWESGKWLTNDCASVSLPYICKINGTQSLIGTCPTYTCPQCISGSYPAVSTVISNNRCPPGFIYFDQTGFCYMQVDRTINKNFNDSEAYCKSLGGDLASIHSSQESNFIINNFSNLTADGHSSCYYWIGLYAQNGNWTYTDGSTYDFLGWEPGYHPAPTSNGVAVGILLCSGNPNYWWEIDRANKAGILCKANAIN